MSESSSSSFCCSAAGSSDFEVENVLMCGGGEYTTGYTESGDAAKDKKCGVVALTLFDLKRRKKVKNLGICTTNGLKLKHIKNHLNEAIHKVYKNMNVDVCTWPEDNKIDKRAYVTAIDNFLKEGDAITIFTPDNTHFEIASFAIRRQIHVLLTKPPVKTLEEHKALIDLAMANNVLVQIEYHKRWDSIYIDARQQIKNNGDFSYFYSYMSQPKSQLKTFKSWAGLYSDISFYLNSHHIDFHCWCMEGKALPIDVSAYASTGVAVNDYGCTENTEDVITVVCRWKNIPSGNIGVAVYTAAWIAPNNAEVHTQQRFTCLSHKGEVRVDQSHRGYDITKDNSYTSANPLFMKYTSDDEGYFAGQEGYGYKSIESFIDNCILMNKNKTSLLELNKRIPTINNTLTCTAILEAARKSLDEGKSIAISI